MSRPIGGFFPLAIDQMPAAAVTPWQSWTNGAGSILRFHSARAALAWLLRRKSIRRLWLPAYICPELADAALNAGAELAFYPVGDRLMPDTAMLGAHLLEGDAVLGVAYFGFSPPSDFLRLAATRPDVLWIEDRAQAFDPGASPWGDWVVYSPRKLLGVPDGGLLVSYRQQLAEPPLQPSTELAFMSPALLRLEDPDESDHRRWYARYRTIEQAVTASPESMSRLSCELLRRLDAAAISAARRRNFASLSRAFSSIALPSPAEPSSAVPFGLPIRVNDAAAIAGKLAEAGIFCARHWSALPSDPDAFAAEHRLARSLLTLPCDQRYGEAEMRRIIDAVAAILR